MNENNERHFHFSTKYYSPTKTKALQTHTVNLNELRHVPPTKESQIEA